GLRGARGIWRHDGRGDGPGGGRARAPAAAEHAVHDPAGATALRLGLGRGNAAPGGQRGAARRAGARGCAPAGAARGGGPGLGGLAAGHDPARAALHLAATVLSRCALVAAAARDGSWAVIAAVSIVYFRVA